MLSVSGLGFLGYATEPPTPEWGLLVDDGRDHQATSWWLSVLPGLAIAATVLALHYAPMGQLDPDTETDQRDQRVPSQSSKR